MFRALQHACRNVLCSSATGSTNLGSPTLDVLPSCVVFVHSVVRNYSDSDEEARRLERKRKSRAKALSWTSRPAKQHDESSAPLQDGLEGDQSIDSKQGYTLESRGKLPIFIDRLRVTVEAGRGGSGCVSYWRSRAKGKFRPPDGGSGGRGGDVIVEASSNVKSLAGLGHMHKAGSGAHGGRQKLTGQNGRHCIIKVPLGTVVYAREEQQLPEFNEDSDTEEESSLAFEEDTRDEDEGLSTEERLKRRLGDELADLSQPGQQFTVAAGGEGGRGNAYAISRAGMEEDRVGQPGQRRVITLEVRVLADIGLVGAPNAGKSSLLRALSAAAPKVAPYPFTTLRPHLGSVQYDWGFSLTVADIPGLIPGAAENRGLGHAFLRHVSRARALVFVIDVSAGLPPNKEAPRPWVQLAGLQAELRRYSEELAEKPALVVANKVDLLSRSEATLTALKRRTTLPVVPTAAIHGAKGLGSLKQDLAALVRGSLTHA